MENEDTVMKFSILLLYELTPSLALLIVPITEEVHNVPNPVVQTAVGAGANVGLGAGHPQLQSQFSVGYRRLIPAIVGKRKRTSGNGTARRQWLYLYVNVPLIILVKVGISGDYKRRARQVGSHAFGWTVPVFAVKIPFAWQCEQAMHRLFGWLNVRYGGSREWYLFPVAPVAIAFMLLAWAVEWGIWILAGVGVMWVLKG